jgi:N-acetyl-anhydromuramyl-L-alanine amidase AmpD
MRELAGEARILFLILVLLAPGCVNHSGAKPAFVPTDREPAQIIHAQPKENPPSHAVSPAKPGLPGVRFDDEIIVAGQRFRTGTPVVLWTDADGYDAYRVDKRFGDFNRREFADWDDRTQDPQRYNLRDHGLTPQQRRARRGGSWTLPQLQAVVDQVVLHYDAAGTSRRCFEILHDRRHLSAHFLIDLDGTIYQTLDVKERAWHAGVSNSRSIGIEIANFGAYPVKTSVTPWKAWARQGENGQTYYLPPDPNDRASLRTPGFRSRPVRPEPVVGTIQGQRLVQLDYTPQQYTALAHLLAALSEVFPNLPLEAPRDATGRVSDSVLPPFTRSNFRGVLGHYHVSEVKVDPGPALDWNRVLREAKRLVREPP